jgi:hypothetical protein
MTVKELRQYKKIFNEMDGESLKNFVVRYQTLFMEASKFGQVLKASNLSIWLKDPTNDRGFDVVSWKDVVSVYEKSKNPEYFL